MSAVKCPCCKKSILHFNGSMMGTPIFTCLIETCEGFGSTFGVEEGDHKSWSFKSRAVNDWGYVFSTRFFADEQSARAYFHSAKMHATTNGGAGSLHCNNEQVERFSIWCPND